eukprot:973585-Rhodomonas_salina.1
MSRLPLAGRHSGLQFHCQCRSRLAVSRSIRPCLPCHDARWIALSTALVPATPDTARPERTAAAARASHPVIIKYKKPLCH